MNKKIIIVLFFIITATSILGSLWFVNKSIYPLWNANIFNVSAEQPLNNEKVKIYFGISVNSISRDNDLDLFNEMQKYTILFNGIKHNEMKNEYGENDFLITYDDKYYFSFRQFKTYWRAQHTYNINIKELEGKPFLQVEIQGHESMKFARSMLLIAEAEKYRCNVLKEKAGVIYNMVELVDK